MKIKITVFIIISTQLTACTYSRELITDNTLFKTTAVKSDNESDQLYAQYLDAKKNIKPQKKFSRPSSEAAPKPDEGPTTPDSTPYLNLRANTRLKQEYMGDRPFPVRAGKVKAGEESNFSVKSCCNTGPLNWGAWIQPIPFPVVNLWGVYAGHRIDTTLNLPNNELLYSPTTAPPNQANLEVTTIYDRWQGGSGGAIKRYVGVWNHKLADFQVPKQMDSPIFLSNYVGNFSDGDFYFLKIIKTSTTTGLYEAFYYNFQTSSWESQYSYDSGSFGSGQSSGWSIHEPKWDDICPTLPTLKSSVVQVFNGTNWLDNTPANGATVNSGGMVCPNWTYTWLNNYYEWRLN